MSNRLQKASIHPYGFRNKTTTGTFWNGVKLVERDEQGQTEYIRAALATNVLITETLAGFRYTDIKVPDGKDRTALHWAMVKG